MSRNPLLESLRAAVDAAPEDLHLRLHLARLLAETGERAEAVRHAATVLLRDPEQQDALDLIAAGSSPPATPVASPATATPETFPATARPEALPGTATPETLPATARPEARPTTATPEASPTTFTAVAPAAPATPGATPTTPATASPAGPAVAAAADPALAPFLVPAPTTEEDLLRRLDAEFTGVVPPMFVVGSERLDRALEAREEYAAGQLRDELGDPDDVHDLDEPDDLDDLGGSGRLDDLGGSGRLDDLGGSGRLDDLGGPGGLDGFDVLDDLDGLDGFDGLDGLDGLDEDEDEDGSDLSPLLAALTPAVSGLRLADVAGMDDVKARLEVAVLAPLRNPELVRLYGTSLRGGLLLYGPPGCGKTFVARALAGEMGARLLTVSLADVLDSYVGQSERNIHAVFEIARRNPPCVVFLDELDALGQKRTQLRGSASRGTVNQLLTEMDGLSSDNEGVFVLGATNHPWDVDVAFRRPGRFDRAVLVLPPDERAREAVLRHHLRERPIAAVDTGVLARLTPGYSGADLAYVCHSAAERALLDSVRSGQPRMIEMADLEAAVRDSRPTIGAWLQTARAVVRTDGDGGYDDLLAYLRAHRPA